MSLNKIPRGFRNISYLEQNLKNKDEGYWIHLGEKRAISLFHQMAKRVPAYKDLLKLNKVTPEKIKSISDFKLLPTIDKNSYLLKYPLEMLCWDGMLKEKRWTFATNSGSTGETLYFPREIDQDWQYAVSAELYLRNNFEIHKRATLYIDSFAMGAWIGGLFTYEAIRLLAESGKYRLSIFTPGIFKDEVLKAVVELGPKFDQIILGGYPPFVKDIIDEGIKLGLHWNKYKLGFIFSAESFLEEFRDYILEKTKTKEIYRSSLNHYGTADMGTMAYETPLSILVRRTATANNGLFKKLFTLERTPTFAQYNPALFYFEAENNSLYCSSYSGLPLVRYDLKDLGGICKISDVRESFTEEGLSLNDEILRSRLENYVWNLPFVFVYERSDFAVKLYGANIFPETIRKAFHDKRISKFITGKFTLTLQYDTNQNQFLQINVELNQGAELNAGFKIFLQKIVVERLLKENSEYKSNYLSDKTRHLPRIVFWKYGDEKYFRSGLKQKWVQK